MKAMVKVLSLILVACFLLQIAFFTASADYDTTPPTVPSDLNYTSVTETTIGLSWTASTDDVGVTGYDIYRDDTMIGSASGTSFTDTGLTAGTIYSYHVIAEDAANNISNASNTISVLTLSAVSEVIQVAAGFNFTVILKDNGTVWIWGQNDWAQSGNGTTSDYVTLVQVQGLTDIVQISAGVGYCMALKSDGTVYAWGRNWHGELGVGDYYAYSSGVVQVSGLTNVEQISAGNYHGLALKTDGTVWAWGYGEQGQLGNGSTDGSAIPVQVSNLTDVEYIAAGSISSYAVKADGTAWSWGDNEYGQLGNGTTNDATTPVQVSGLTGVSTIAGGEKHALALLTNGTVKAWGNNGDAQLGNNSFVSSNTPVDVTNLSDPNDAIYVATGFYQGLVIETDGTAVSWGINDYGMLGDGTDTAGQLVPTDVVNISNLVEIDGGRYHSVALDANGTVWSWGDNTYGQLGGFESSYSHTPVESRTSNGEMSFANSSYTIEIPESGTNTLTVSASGTDENGDPIDTANITYSLENTYAGVTIDSTTGAVTVTTEATVGSVNVVATYQTLTATATLSLETDNEGEMTFNSSTYTMEIPDSDTNTLTVSATGTDANGDPINPANITYSLENTYAGVTIDSSTGVVTVTTEALEGSINIVATYQTLTCTATLNIEATQTVNGEVIQVTAGMYFTVILKDDGTVWIWGRNDWAQSGDGTTSDYVPLKQVQGLTDIVQISAGVGYCMALKSDGTVYAWGRNWHGELGDGDNYAYSSGVVQVSGLTSVEQISAGNYHGLALKTDGTVWAWGYGDEGQLGDGNATTTSTPVQVSNLTDVEYIAAGSISSYAVKSDGTAWCWGDNEYGQLGNGTTTDATTPVQLSGLTGVNTIVGGQHHALALLTNGAVKAWGSNDNGQLGDGTYVDSNTPIDVTNLSDAGDAIAVAAGYNHSLAIEADGTAVSWGAPDYGKLGDGTEDWRSIPTAVLNISNLVNIDGGLYHSVALDDDGTVWSWGDNTYGQLGGSASAYSYTPIESRTSNGDLSFANSSYSIAIPDSDTNTLTVSASGMDENGDPIDPANITYSLENTYAGVTIDSATGVVTVTNEATVGSVNVIATYQTLTATITLNIGTGGSRELTLSVITGRTYRVSLSARKISTFDQVTYTVTYDDEVLQIADLCAFTHEKETTTGVVDGTGITITSVSPGEIQLTINKTIPSGFQWWGVLNIFEFTALTTGQATITIQ